MGEVWLAHDVRIDREIAIKLMRGGGSSDPDAVARFLPSSFSIQGGMLVLHPWAVTVSPSALLFVMFAIVLLQLVGNTVILDAQRTAQDRAQELLHVPSWQLGQLVRSSGSQS